MNTKNDFMIKKVKYDNFNNKLVTLITNKNLSKEFAASLGQTLSEPTLLSLDGENEWITIAEFTIGVKGNFKIRSYECFAYDGRELRHPITLFGLGNL